MNVKKIQDIVEIANVKGVKKLAVASAQDADLMAALFRAVREGLISPILVGNKTEITTIAESAGLSISGVEVIHEPDADKACEISVRMVRNGNADFIMKGNVRTSVFVKRILDKNNGLMTGNLLSHVAFFETPHYHKILGITDAALNIAPDINEKVDIIQNAVVTCNKLGIMNPKIGILAAVEVVNNKMEATVHADILKKMNQQEKLKGCIVDGPLALDNAISADAAKHKGIVSEVAGDVDILLAPEINSGNILYKSLSFLGGASAAAIVTGATIPVVLTSRSDSDKNKFFSIALAVALL